MDTADHQRLIAELDSLLARIAELMQGFESSGLTVTMKDDYITLHGFQARALKQRQEHTHALDEDCGLAVATTRPVGAVH